MEQIAGNLSRRPGAPLFETLKLARNVAYRNTDHAIAELVDNSIDAGANSVQILLIEEDFTHSSGKTTNRVTEVMVIDNGCGMSPDVLDKAITISGSESSQQNGKIGRFGYGLIYSSIYTCNRLDIWSWESSGFGLEDAIHAYVDMDELEADRQRSSHYYPTREPIAKYIRTALTNPSAGSGTIVRWKNFTNFSWKRSETVVEKAEKIIGRLYRRYLCGKGNRKLDIYFTIAKKKGDEECEIRESKKSIRPNDPMYLIAPSNTPGFGDEPMFTLYTEPEMFPVECQAEGVSGSLKIAYSCVTRDNLFKNARDDREAGARPWGKHAFENAGISLLREGRELCLLRDLYKETQDRWWGIEIEFTKDLDAFFGVTSDKQQATKFQDCLSQYSSLVGNRESLNAFMEEMQSTGEVEHRLIKLVDKLYNARRILLDRVKSFRANTRTKKDEPISEDVMRDPAPLSLVDSAAAKASDARRRFLERYPQNHSVDEDISSATPEQVQKLREELTNELIENPLRPDQETINKIDRLIALNRKYIFQAKSNTESQAFLIPMQFDISVKAVCFNKSHPFYTEVLQSLEQLTDSNGDSLDVMSQSEIKELLKKATTGLYIAFASWCELELEAVGSEKDRLQNARSRWGVAVRDFLESSGVQEDEAFDESQET